MISNELLEEKWRVQQKLAEIAGYNIKEMLDNAENTVQEIQEKYGFKVIFSKRKATIVIKKH
jgi:hypothetical protein